MERIGKYQVTKKLITTGFSDIYLCRDPDLELEVAIKVFSLKGKNAESSAKYGPDVWRQRFLREARVLAKLDHPHIVAVKELSSLDDGTPYFVMPFIEANLIYEIGKDVMDADEIAALPPRERPRGLQPGRAMTIFRQLSSALAELHRHGLVHRDVKPGNVLLTLKVGGAVKICDFGMVKFPDSKLSRSGIWIGTLDYIAPEQRESAKEVDPRSDVYSAGAIAYRMLTGKLPVGAFPAPAQAAADVPEALSALIMECLAAEKEKRPKDATQVLQRLAAAFPAAFRPQPTARAGRVVLAPKKPPPGEGRDPG